VGSRQIIKAILPVFIALPLVAARAGDTTMTLPFVGHVDFGLVYSLVLVPIGVTGAANAVNMLAGFNGQEAGVGIVAMVSLAAIAYHLHEVAAFVILIAALGALLATLYYNWYPSRIFIGDVGTLSIGAIIASAVIIGNFEVAGVIVIIPYILEFLIKAKNRFPSNDWWLEYNDGKLYCPESGPVGLGQLIAKAAGGMTERNITLSIMGLEAICGGVAIWLFW
jgi:UDP-N-acetylglucosamine--dolichyl-phosphate N-acetylglucosaminephosphotransferase